MTTQPAGDGRVEIGTILNRVIETYSATAGVLIPGAIIVFLPVALLAAAFDGTTRPMALTICAFGTAPTSRSTT